MAKISIPPGKEARFKKIGIVLVTLLTLYILYSGASVSNTGVRVAKSGKREKATFVTLARNQDLYSLASTIKNVEDRFNHQYNYDWVFLNDADFTEEFKEVTSRLVSGTTKYGKVPKEHWSYPEWIDQNKAAETRQKMKEEKVIYGDSVSYRHMCRFESGFFYKHPLLDDYDWYWRVEPDVKFHCDINYDVFRFMRENGKKYGFTISLREYDATIRTLWPTTVKFMNDHPQFIHENNMMDFISDDGGLSYNLCHFWSNFEIGSLDFLRSHAYNSYFDYLDKAGGFFYERWGDAPVHSIAAALFLDRNEIHHFSDIGYYHIPFSACPLDPVTRFEGKCSCNPKQDFTWNGYSCASKFYTVNNMKKPEGWQELA
ncbi:hypothetical protein KAFR_0J01950 [Kazachstania africana CBS 2517]|uniref:Glycosyltransferase family 15 protein n=1 Tax=Kazachstania africana (strain ATCC 22294 / BCRC 22015 / CBS 2517 / CECT 1963 / NBRC 1671 / NRRL Y-8276) TaxID=1071382 RepID=H2B0V9_KAZAF|nr:hypothetical protein KAFR_0J01950 [Kazachstania africana CBS 2517]CCF60259.1 hypothetical protein KAFR_0J01950 [Kazachstania africana CBS 2517]